MPPPSPAHQPFPDSGGPLTRPAPSCPGGVRPLLGAGPRSAVRRPPGSPRCVSFRAGASELPSPARILGTGGTASRAGRASQITGEANLGSRSPSRGAGETATLLLPVPLTPHPKMQNPRLGRTGSPLPPPIAPILRAREAPAPRRWLAKGSGKGGWMGPRGGVVMRGM